MAEIRKFSDIIGVVTTEAIVEGRCVLLTAAPAGSGPFGSNDDLPGVKLPTSEAEAALARYVLGWAMDNRPTPMISPMPAYNYIIRNYGFESGQRSPDTLQGTPLTGQTIYLTTPSVTQGLTIPSGTLALAYAGGVYTFPSGHFVDSADIRVVGNLVAVQSAGGADRGKPMYSATGVFGKVEQFDLAKFAVTVRTLVP